MIGSSAAVTASIPPVGSRSCLCATWMTPSEFAAASLSPSRSSRLPRRTVAPCADSAAAAVSDRARPVTSCPAAISSGTMYEPEWPVPPVTKTRMLLLLVSDVVREVVVRVRSAENADAEEEVGVLDRVGDEAHLQPAGVLQRPRHGQGRGDHRAQSHALDEGTDGCLRLRVGRGDEHVEWGSIGRAGSQNI